MFSKKAFPYVMPFWISFIVVVIMCCVMSIVNAGGIHFPGIMRDTAIGTAVAYAASVLLPVTHWSEAFTGLFPVRHGSAAYILLNNVIPTLVMGILMTLLFTYLAIGFPPFFKSYRLGHQIPRQKIIFCIIISHINNNCNIYNNIFAFFNR